MTLYRHDFNCLKSVKTLWLEEMQGRPISFYICKIEIQQKATLKKIVPLSYKYYYYYLYYVHETVRHNMQIIIQ